MIGHCPLLKWKEAQAAFVSACLLVRIDLISSWTWVCLFCVQMPWREQDSKQELIKMISRKKKFPPEFIQRLPRRTHSLDSLLERGLFYGPFSLAVCVASLRSSCMGGWWLRPQTLVLPMNPQGRIITGRQCCAGPGILCRLVPLVHWWGRWDSRELKIPKWGWRS